MCILICRHTTAVILLSTAITAQPIRDAHNQIVSHHSNTIISGYRPQPPPLHAPAPLYHCQCGVSDETDAETACRPHVTDSHPRYGAQSAQRTVAGPCWAPLTAPHPPTGALLRAPPADSPARRCPTPPAATQPRPAAPMARWHWSRCHTRCQRQHCRSMRHCGQFCVSMDASQQCTRKCLTSGVAVCHPPNYQGLPATGTGQHQAALLQRAWACGTGGRGWRWRRW